MRRIGTSAAPSRYRLRWARRRKCPPRPSRSTTRRSPPRRPASREAAMRVHPPQTQTNPTTQRFIFATGIECSYPTIQTPHGRVRQDELEKCGHYAHWQEDLQLTRELGLRYLRYGPPLYRMYQGPDRYDWSWT